MRKFGLHTSIAGGLWKALERGAALGCDTVQIFSRNPRGWAVHPIAAEEAALFKATRAATGIGPVYIHTAYLLNVASPDEALRSKSLLALRDEMSRASALGAEYVVLHPGSAHDDRGRERAARSIREAIEGGGFTSGLLIENTSGKRGDTTARMEDLGDLVSMCGPSVAGVCIDTCHAFAAGYDMREQAGLAALVKGLRGSLPEGAVRLIHLNDSKGAPGTGLDRHEQIGDGHIGRMGLRAFLSHPAFSGIPAVLETPRETDGDDIENLRRARLL